MRRSELAQSIPSQALYMFDIKKSTNPVWEFGMEHVLRSNVGIAGGSPSAISSSVCRKYSSVILFAQVVQSLIGRVGLETSAHLISILLRRILFSGVAYCLETSASDPMCWKAVANFDKCSKCFDISVA